MTLPDFLNDLPLAELASGAVGAAVGALGGRQVGRADSATVALGGQPKSLWRALVPSLVFLIGELARWGVSKLRREHPGKDGRSLVFVLAAVLGLSCAALWTAGTVMLAAELEDDELELDWEPRGEPPVIDGALVNKNRPRVR